MVLQGPADPTDSLAGARCELQSPYRIGKSVELRILKSRSRFGALGSGLGCLPIRSTRTDRPEDGEDHTGRCDRTNDRVNGLGVTGPLCPLGPDGYVAATIAVAQPLASANR